METHADRLHRKQRNEQGAGEYGGRESALLVDLASFPVNVVLSRLLEDKTKRSQNIIFATEGYFCAGNPIQTTAPLTVDLLRDMGFSSIQPRVCKSKSEQFDRTHKKGEVFTPSWVCNKMNNQCDAAWFRRKDVFNRECGVLWIPKRGKIKFSGRKTWKQYVDSKYLEITCGEAPYIVSRYDASTGELLPLKSRIGILDRKLRVVGENTNSFEDWCVWALRAVQSVYGYEYQGDNVLIARVNILLAFVDYLQDKWHVSPERPLLRKVANVIAWNIWQMNGLTGTVVTGESDDPDACGQMDLFALADGVVSPANPFRNMPCKIRDWRKDKTFFYNNLH